MKNLLPCVYLGAAAVLSAGCADTVNLASPAAAPAAGGYTVLQRIALPGDERWDYLVAEPSGGRVFISRAEYVQVVDGASGRLLGTIPGTPGVHGIALAPDLGVGFTSNGHGNSITVFDLASLAVLGVIPVGGENPDAIVYDAPSRRVFTFNGKSQTASVVDAARRVLVGTVALPGHPEFAVGDGTGRIYFNVEDKAELAVLDTGSATVTQVWPLGDCEDPSGLALDRVHHRSFSTCQNGKMPVLDTVDGHVVATLPIGARPDAAAFDAGRGMAFSANGEGTLSLFHEDDPDHFSAAGTLSTRVSARTVALARDTGVLYLSSADMQKGGDEDSGARPKPVPGSFALVVVAPPR